MSKTPSLHSLTPRSRAVVGAGIGLVAVLVLTVLRPFYLLEGVELRLIDVLTRHFVGTRAPDERIVIVEIQEEDVVAVQKGWAIDWPWPLAVNAMAFGVMREAGVAAVLVDLYHLDQGAGPDDTLIEGDIESEEMRAELERLEIEAEMGEEYGAALASVGSVALAFELTRNPDYDLPGRVRAAEPRLTHEGLEDGPPDVRMRRANFPVRRVLEGARHLGFANVWEDADGVVRQAPTVARLGDRLVISLPVAGALLATGAEVELGPDSLRIGDATQRLMPDGSFLVNFRGAPGATYVRVPPYRLLNWAAALSETGELPAEARQALAGRIVVWGINISGVKDVITAPTAGTLHGPEFQATALDNLLHGDGRVRAGRLYNAVVLACVCVILGLLSGLLQRRSLFHVLPALTILCGFAFAVWRFRAGTSIDVFTPFLGVVATWGGTSFLHLMTEGRRNKWLEGTFGRYLAPSIIEALKEDPSLLALGGKRKDITIFFSDVAGFTKLSQQLEPPQVVQLLNRYLTPHAAAVMENGGVVDKFIGDAVVAFFGDPVPVEGHAIDACRTALEVRRRLPELRPVWEEMGLTEFEVRIGLNSGHAVVGNMGSDQRFDYTCMGDEVNLASRLEGANKAFGTKILIGGKTFDAAAEAIVARRIAQVVVVGRSVPEPVFELLAMRDDATVELLAMWTAWERAWEAAREGDLDVARAGLEQVERLRPGDAPSRWLAGLLDRVEAGEEPSPWSGVVVLDAK